MSNLPAATEVKMPSQAMLVCSILTPSSSLSAASRSVVKPVGCLLSSRNSMGGYSQAVAHLMTFLVSAWAVPSPRTSIRAAKRNTRRIIRQTPIRLGDVRGNIAKGLKVPVLPCRLQGYNKTERPYTIFCKIAKLFVLQILLPCKAYPALFSFRIKETWQTAKRQGTAQRSPALIICSTSPVQGRMSGYSPIHFFTSSSYLPLAFTRFKPSLTRAQSSVLSLLNKKASCSVSVVFRATCMLFSKPFFTLA